MTGLPQSLSAQFISSEPSVQSSVPSQRLIYLINLIKYNSSLGSVKSNCKNEQMILKFAALTMDKTSPAQINTVSIYTRKLAFTMTLCGLSGENDNYENSIQLI